MVRSSEKYDTTLGGKYEGGEVPEGTEEEFNQFMSGVGQAFNMLLFGGLMPDRMGFKESDGERMQEAQENAQDLWDERIRNLGDNPTTWAYGGMSAIERTETYDTLTQMRREEAFEQERNLYTAIDRAERFKAYNLDHTAANYVQTTVNPGNSRNTGRDDRLFDHYIEEKHRDTGLSGNFLQGYQAKERSPNTYALPTDVDGTTATDLYNMNIFKAPAQHNAAGTTFANWYYNAEGKTWTPFDGNNETHSSLVVGEKDLPHLLGVGGTGTESTTVAQLMAAVKAAALSNNGVLNAASLAPQLAKYDTNEHAYYRGDGRDSIAPTTHLMLALIKKQGNLGYTDAEINMLRASASEDIQRIFSTETAKLAVQGNTIENRGKLGTYIGREMDAFFTKNKYDPTLNSSVNAFLTKQRQLALEHAAAAAQAAGTYGDNAPAAAFDSMLAAAGITGTGTGTSGATSGTTGTGTGTSGASDGAPNPNPNPNPPVVDPEVQMFAKLGAHFRQHRNRPMRVKPTQKPNTSNFFEAYGNTTLHH